MRHFKLSEFDCQHTGKNEMDSTFLILLDNLRHECGFPFVITSGYRDITHPIEAKKFKGGTHSQGIACDIKVNNGLDRGKLIELAIEQGFTGIGVHKDFVHVDIRKGDLVVWAY